MPIIPALRRLRQENTDFGTSLSYVVRSCLKINKLKNILFNEIMRPHKLKIAFYYKSKQKIMA
jgi:hypothetical protein